MADRQQLYILNIQDIIRGDVRPGPVQSIDSLVAIREDSLMGPTGREVNFRRQYEEQERYNLSSIAVTRDLDDAHFVRPMQGLVTEHYNPGKRQFGIVITAEPNTAVLAALEGTVLLSAYTVEAGYVIQVQHSQDFISIYKHCGSLLKREGDKVKSGEAIALLGASDTPKAAPYLHFEIWHKGRALNPEQQIVFL
jgi:lipoprotein NlpD